MRARRAFFCGPAKADIQSIKAPASREAAFIPLERLAKIG
jgi:hypothetical protein